jgi:hypothetical protein
MFYFNLDVMLKIGRAPSKRYKVYLKPLGLSNYNDINRLARREFMVLPMRNW